MAQQYGEFLKNLLRPLGIYDLTDGSVNGSALDALGSGLDGVSGALDDAEREALLATAEDEGLERREALFARRTARAYHRSAPGGHPGAGASYRGDRYPRRHGLTLPLRHRQSHRNRNAGTVQVRFPMWRRTGGLCGTPDICWTSCPVSGVDFTCIICLAHAVPGIPGPPWRRRDTP